MSVIKCLSMSGWMDKWMDGYLGVRGAAMRRLPGNDDLAHADIDNVFETIDRSIETQENPYIPTLIGPVSQYNTPEP